MPSDLTVFEDICAGRYQTVREMATGRKIAGYMCSYAPQELLHAAGYVPVRIMGRLQATPRADALMQSFICSFARSTFDAGLSGEFDFLDIALFAHTCDTMQNLADLWQANCPGMKTIITALPNLHSGEAAADYFRAELDRVRGCIEEICGPISDAALLESIQLYDRHRNMMKALHALRCDHPDLITGTQMMAVLLSSYLIPREDHLALVSDLHQKLKAVSPAPSSGQPRIVVGGSVCQISDFIAAIEAAGCLVADDDLCMGTRSYLFPKPSGEDPMDILTQTYLSRDPCPAIYKPDFDPALPMLERVRRVNADGVVFLITKFCDPFAFDYPHLSEQLEKAGVPSLMLEIEQHLPVPEQLRTRVEAFIEVLQTRKG